MNDKTPPNYVRKDPSFHPVALITQHTNFLSDLSVNKFLKTHIKVRNPNCNEIKSIINETMEFANQLTGEPIFLKCKMTELFRWPNKSLVDCRCCSG